MTKLRVLEGQRFGRLVVGGIAGQTKSGNYTWFVTCDCGTDKVVASDHLVRRRDPVVSCGCYRDDRIRQTCSPNPNETAFNLLLGAYRKRARLKQVEFSITADAFRALVRSDCFYCGAPPAQKMHNRPKSGVFVYNGLDKVDAGGAYRPGNCVPCCKACNYMKGTLSSADFKAQVARIFKHWCAS